MMSAANLPENFTGDALLALLVNRQADLNPISGLMVISDQQVVEFRVTTLSELIAIWLVNEQERGAIVWP
jgi:hypothetical protein